MEGVTREEDMVCEGGEKVPPKYLKKFTDHCLPESQPSLKGSYTISNVKLYFAMCWNLVAHIINDKVLVLPVDSSQ